MQFNVIAIVIAAMAASANAVSTVTVYACETSVAVKTSGVASPTVASIASTGVKTVATPTGSPIAYATGAASMNTISGSALGMIIAGGVALLI